MQEQGSNPVFMGSFGTSFLYVTSDDQWLKALFRYLNGEFVSDNVNSLLPGQMGVSWAIGLQNIGILDADFQTVSTKILSYMTSAMPPSPAPTVAPSAMPSPRRPTATPSG